MQNLLVRSLSGSVYVALILGGCFGHLYGPSILMLIIGGIAIFEWQSIRPNNFQSGNYIFSILIFLLSAALFNPLLQIDSKISLILKSALGLVASIFILTQSFSRKNETISILSHNGFGFIYLFPALFILPIFSNVLEGNHPWLLASVFILIWTSDTFAYLSGRFLGKNKLFERISPKKTWEGFLGGLLFTVAAAIILAYYLDFLSTGAWIGLGILVAICGTLGDLFESAIKRNFKVKDSGSFIPGHGGILDRIDSLLLVLPLAYLYLSIIYAFGL